MQVKLMPLTIFYGSQQGTAAKFAKILCEEGRKEGFITNAIDLNDSPNGEKMEPGTAAIFCLATHGEGDPTDNAKEFMKWIRDTDANHDTLKGFKFTVFGLGNTQYEHYNKVGRDANKILEQLGAVRIYKYGEGDDN